MLQKKQIEKVTVHFMDGLNPWKLSLINLYK